MSRVFLVQAGIKPWFGLHAGMTDSGKQFMLRKGAPTMSRHCIMHFHILLMSFSNAILCVHYLMLLNVGFINNFQTPKDLSILMYLLQ